MKKIYVLYQTDHWHSTSSRVLFVICETKEECVAKLWEKYGAEQTDNSVLLNEEMRDKLLVNGQTQNSGDFDWEFDIDTYTLGEMYE